MILKNNRGIEREFNILFEVKNNSNNYIIYKDPTTGNIYSGKYEENLLKILNEEEFNFINNIFEELNS